jgi:hypothetical protein
MPNIDPPAPIAPVIRMGESIKMRETSKEAALSTEEITPVAENKQESSIPIETAQKAVTQEEINVDSAFVPGTVKAQKLGERQRKLAKLSLDNALRNPDDRESFIKDVQGDPDLSKYYQQHFSQAWNDLLETPTGESEINKTQATKDQLRLEVLAEEIRLEKKETGLDLAQRLKFTQAQADDLQRLADKLEGTTIDGKELDWEQALQRAARIIAPTKAKAGITVLPSGKGADRDEITKVNAQHEKLADGYRERTGIRRDKDEMIKNLDTVSQGYDEKSRRFVMPL